MRLFLKSRDVSTLALAVAATILLVWWPGSAALADASPMGAPAAIAVLVGALVPSIAARGCSRRDDHLEACTTRPVVLYDVLLILATMASCLVPILLLTQLGLAQEGVRAARSLVTSTGILLATGAVGNWTLASITPLTYLVLVLVAGRGPDDAHPAPWAWIAAPAGDPQALALAVASVVVGLAMMSRVRPTVSMQPGTDES